MIDTCMLIDSSRKHAAPATDWNACKRPRLHPEHKHSVAFVQVIQKMTPEQWDTMLLVRRAGCLQNHAM